LDGSPVLVAHRAAGKLTFSVAMEIEGNHWLTPLGHRVYPFWTLPLSAIPNLPTALPEGLTDFFSFLEPPAPAVMREPRYKEALASMPIPKPPLSWRR